MKMYRTFIERVDEVEVLHETKHFVHVRYEFGHESKEKKRSEHQNFFLTKVEAYTFIEGELEKERVRVLGLLARAEENLSTFRERHGKELGLNDEKCLETRRA